MPELLLEVGCEELPASFVRKAYTDLAEAVTQSLKEAGVLGPSSKTQTLGTPRRLIVSVTDLIDRQADSVKEMRGPSLKAAFDDAGEPSKALLGFCRGQGVEVADLRKDDQYVWADKRIEGRPTAEILTELLPKAIRGLSFDKTMRWGSSRMRFARPIRWMLGAFGGEAVSFEIEGVASGLESRGHRFYAPDAFKATTFDQLISELRARKVEPDAEIRKQMILDGAKAVAGGTPELPEALVDENTFLTEWPTPIQGSFRDDYLELPDPVLVTAMAKHEKMFPVRDADGKLTKHFVFVRNSGETDTVRKGNEWVLNARFNDARFFFDEDKKSNLDGFLEKTSGILFQEKLGTVRQRAERLQNLAKIVAQQTGANAAEIELAGKAGLYAKADLSTGLVSELASLQGIIGGEYARQEGFAQEVAWAIGTQYDPAKNASPSDAKGRTAVRLLIADQLDKLAGYLGLGLAPSGSSDPFGLRRAASILIDAAWNWPGDLPSYGTLLTAALEEFAKQGVQLDAAAAQASIQDVFVSRYTTQLSEARHDVLEAAILGDSLLPKTVRFRVGLVTELAKDEAFVQTLTRPLNILVGPSKKGIPFAKENALASVDGARLDSKEGEALLAVLKGQSEAITKAAASLDSAVLSMLRNLAGPINQFFEAAMVLVEDENVRYARLSLMQATVDQILLAGDVSKLVFGGEKA